MDNLSHVFSVTTQTKKQGNTSSMNIEQLCDACEAGDDDMVQAILSAGVVDVNSANKYGDIPLFRAIQSNHTSTVKMLLSNPCTKFDITNSNGQTGLHVACFYNSDAVIRVFGSDIRCNKDIVNLKENSGDTAVMVAVGWGNLDCVREMAKFEGTDFGTKNREGATLIEVAKKLEHAKIVDFLEKGPKGDGTNKTFEHFG